MNGSVNQLVILKEYENTTFTRTRDALMKILLKPLFTIVKKVSSKY